ncbi:hypothetical protein ACIKT0_15060, partial [Hansschlegelia beijingensis]|uniref:hypothetical protein n=1 Tax=Hansschlegelia beijingensis TaxID=1133344 RepID=UPI00387F2C81
QIRIRGSEGNQTLVIVDGIRMNDPGTSAEFDFANLLSSSRRSKRLSGIGRPGTTWRRARWSRTCSAKRTSRSRPGAWRLTGGCASRWCGTTKDPARRA